MAKAKEMKTTKIPISSSDEKPKKLDTITSAISKIEAAYGKGSAFLMGADNKLRSDNFVKTGHMGLDFAMGLGVPRGKIVEVYGPESSGKTTFALECIRAFQAIGLKCGFVDAEHALDPDHLKWMGVDIKKVLVSQPDSGEEALSIVGIMCEDLDLIVVDSVAALVPQKELDGDMGDAQMGAQARLMSQAMRKLTGKTSKNNCTIIFINQIRSKIGVMFGCFHYDTLVNFIDGRSVPIGKVVDDKIEGEVWSYNETTEEFEANKITDWYDNGKVEEASEFVHIQTQSIPFNELSGGGQFGFTCTTNHKLMTDSGWKEAKDISHKDKLVSKYSKKINNDLDLFLRGMLVGDSHIAIRHKNTATLRLQDIHNPEYVLWKISKLEKFYDFRTVLYFAHNKQLLRYDTTYEFELSKVKQELGNRDPMYFFEKPSVLGLAIWFMDDVHYDNTNSHSRYRLSIKRLSKHPVKLQVIVEAFKKYISHMAKSSGIFSLDPNIIFDKAGTIIFNKETSDFIGFLIKKYIPECMQYKLPEKYRGNYIDFELDSEDIIKEHLVDIKEIRIASLKQMRNKRKFDIGVENNSNYMVGGIGNGVVVHNSNETTTGGNALKFYASMRIDVRKQEFLYIGTKEDSNVIGQRCRFKMVKNKCAPPFKKTEFEIYFPNAENYPTGIIKEYSYLTEGIKNDIIKKSGSWYSYCDNQIGQGQDGAAKFLIENPNIAKEIITKLNKLMEHKIIGGTIDVKQEKEPK